MGNQPSRQDSDPNASSHPNASSSASGYQNVHGRSSHGSHQPGSPTTERKQPRRRESIQALSNILNRPSQPAPPSASLESATAHVESSRTSTPLPARPHSRNRSQTVNVASLKPTDADESAMGNEQSKPKKQAPAPPPPHTAAKAVEQSKPVQIPATTPEDNVAAGDKQQQPPKPAVKPVDQVEDPAESYHAPHNAQFSRPPRLPLPIEEELHTPGSPIISPADFAADAVEPLEQDGGPLQRRASVLSGTTVDDEDEGDNMQAETDQAKPAVPTIIEWRGRGERVYVTGTFAGWDRKYRLHRDGPSKHKGALSATIKLIPGTHHLKFIVDGDMVLSDHLPTAVDFTNILVNYIEVTTDPSLQLQEKAQAIDIPQKQPPQDAKKPESRVPADVYPPQVLPPTPEVQQRVSTPDRLAQRPKDSAPTSASNLPKAPSTTAKSVPLAPHPPQQYHSQIPRYLLDLDSGEDSTRFQRASAAVHTTPAPPTLPMFLTKSILNGQTPMKDDSSVLNYPNHTVLNHLTTSSIRQNVLATSATTRYKRKFLTTIMYKPTSDTGD